MIKMVHDVLKSDNWWHEYANHVCIIGNDMRIIMKKDVLSVDEIKTLIAEDLDRLNKSHEIIREVYINDRREELKLLHPGLDIRVCSKCGGRLMVDNKTDVCRYCR